MQYSYKFTKLRPIILYIFNFECCICSKFSTSNHVHHLDHNKKNNSPLNLVCVCVDCHKMLHKNISISFSCLPLCIQYKLKTLENQIAIL